MTRSDGMRLAITGFITTAVPSLDALGVKTADIAVMRYDAFGFERVRQRRVRVAGLRREEPDGGQSLH